MNRSTKSGCQNLQFQEYNTIFWNSKAGMIYGKPGKPFFSLESQKKTCNCDCQVNR